jgi:capsular polysaccharide biosynthesis protein
MGSKNSMNEPDLLRMLRALRHRLGVIALSAVLCGAAAFAYARFFLPPLYQASTLVYVNNSAGSAGLSISTSELTAAQKLVNTYVVILKTRTTLNDVIDRADLSYSYEELKEMISAAAVDSTEIFEIVVTGEDPQETEKIANTIGAVLPEKVSNIVDGSAARIVDYAVVPSEKSSPDIPRITVVGFLTGLLLSCGIVLLLDLFDDGIHTEDDLTQNFDLPLLAAIPDLDARTRAYGYDRPKKPGG